MEFFPSVLSAEQSDGLLAHLREHFVNKGFGCFAVDVIGGARCIGFVGLSTPSLAMPFGPCVEVAWRLAPSHWGRGFAREAAAASLDFGFRELGCDEILAWTVPANVRSWGLMERLGMVRDPAEDFDHPRLDAGHPLCRHVLYRLPRARWESTRSPSAIAP